MKILESWNTGILERQKTVFHFLNVCILPLFHLSNVPFPRSSSPASRHCSLHPDKKHVKVLSLDRLKIISSELILARIVSQLVHTAGVVGRAQLNEDVHACAVARGFRFGDIDRSGIEIYRVDRAVRIDGADL